MKSNCLIEHLLRVPPSQSKTFVLDTNVLLHSPQALFVFKNNQVVIPLVVIEEIDNQKRRQDEIGQNAREVSRILDELRSWGNLSEGAPMPEGGMLRVEVNNRNYKELPDKIHMLDHNKADNRILAVALNLQQDEKTARWSWSPRT